MFGTKVASWFDEDMYYSLSGSIARRLYLLYGAHASPWPMRLAELREYIGSSMAQDSKFRDMMNEAHDELKAKGAIRSWKFTQSHKRLDTLAYVVEHRRRPKPVKKTEAVTA
jgi:hypothetical protein